MRPINEKQARLLALLAGGNIVLAPGRSEWTPLLRRGLVEPATSKVDDGSRSYLPPLAITPDGLRALAGAYERGLLPPIKLTPAPPVRLPGRMLWKLDVCAKCGSRADTWHTCSVGGSRDDVVAITVQPTRDARRALEVGA